MLEDCHVYGDASASRMRGSHWLCCCDNYLLCEYKESGSDGSTSSPETPPKRILSDDVRFRDFLSLVPWPNKIRLWFRRFQWFRRFLENRSGGPVPTVPTVPGVPVLTEVQRLISDECDNLKAVLLEKNRKYGNSALNPIRFFSKSSPHEQINVRLDDKLSRLLSGQADETEDIELDILGYLILKRVERKASKTP